MAPWYKRVLLVGATSGIGAAMADKLIREGSAVIAVGRRQERLDEFVKKHGPERASGVRFDVTDYDGMESFVQGIVLKYPDLDCVFLNSGTQAQVHLSRPAEVDLAAFHAEINTNFNALVSLSIKFLPHLLGREGTAVVFTGTHLSFIPAVTLPAYSASKAALSSYISCLRRQNRGRETKIIEISGPVVQTELHDYMGKEAGRAIGMPADKFSDLVYDGLEAGDEHIIIDAIGPEGAYRAMIDKREELFEMLSGRLLANF